jgi:deoxyribonuclease-4
MALSACSAEVDPLTHIAGDRRMSYLPQMPILGAHQSISGGYFRAVERARDCGCQCVQLFTKNNNQWRAKEITDEEAESFRQELVRCGVSHPLAHDS